MRAPISVAKLALFLLSVLPGLSGAAGQCERVVATGAAQSAPYLWRDPQSPQHLIGAYADLLTLIGEELGITVELVHSGDARKAEQEVSSGRIDLLVGGSLTQSRLDSLDFVHPAIMASPRVVWVRKEHGFPYGGWEDLRERKGGVAPGADFGAQFEAFAKANLQLETSANLAQAFQKLLLGGHDYVLAERDAGLALAGSLGVSDKLDILEPPISSEKLYLALSHNSACNDGWLRGQLAKKMTELAASGAQQALLQRNLERWKLQQAQTVDVPPQEQEPSQ